MFIDSSYISLNKFNEELCGDRVVEIRDGKDFIMVLSDGLGSGVKANILATLTSKIVSTMISKGIGIDEVVKTVLSTLPVCEVRKIAYSTFTLIKIDKDNIAYVLQFDNPDLIYIKSGEIKKYNKRKRVICNKNVYESKFKLEENDMFVTFSDGVVHAGVGKTLNLGWQYKNIVNFIQKAYRIEMCAREMARHLIDTCNNLYEGKPGDDTTCIAIKIKTDEIIDVISGPAQDKKMDNAMVREFYEKKGKKIICGGTTSQIVARITKKELTTSIKYYDKQIPPISIMEGIDLVTEGAITLHKVNSLAKKYMSGEIKSGELKKKDGATILFKKLFFESTRVNFYIGRAVNPAHQNPNLPTDFSYKQNIIKDIISKLKKNKKEISCKYF